MPCACVRVMCAVCGDVHPPPERVATMWSVERGLRSDWCPACSQRNVCASARGTGGARTEARAQGESEGRVARQNRPRETGCIRRGTEVCAHRFFVRGVCALRGCRVPCVCRVCIRLLTEVCRAQPEYSRRLEPAMEDGGARAFVLVATCQSLPYKKKLCTGISQRLGRGEGGQQDGSRGRSPTGKA